MLILSKKLILYLAVLLCMSVVWAQSKPVKKTPVREGNFEIIAGETLPVPIDMDKFLSSAQKAAVELGWKIKKVSPGVISLRLENRSWWLEMNICYWDDEYWYEYVQSWNLDANPAKNIIHRKYRFWISNLEKRIAGYYF